MHLIEILSKLSFWMIMQEKFVQGTGFVHETLGAYKTLEELWDEKL